MEAWPAVQPLLELVLAQCFGEWSLEDLLVFLLRGGGQLWLAIDNSKDIKAVVVTEICTFPQRKVCNVWLLAGVDYRLWEDGIKVIEDWAAAQGCSLMTATCRPGLAKRALRYGFSTVREVVHKPIIANQH